MGMLIATSSCLISSASANFPFRDSCSSTPLGLWPSFALRENAADPADLRAREAGGRRTPSYSLDQDSKMEGSGEADGYGTSRRACIAGVSSVSRAKDELKALRAEVERGHNIDLRRKRPFGMAKVMKVEERVRVWHVAIVGKSGRGCWTPDKPTKGKKST